MATVAAAADCTWTGYSLAERDRRWAAVRANAARAGLDCVFVPLGNGLDARYLTQMSNSIVVLPTDVRPPVVYADRDAHNEWVPEPRPARRAWAGNMVQALVDAGMERAHIGVAGLRGGTVTHVRQHDGVVNHRSYAEVLRRLPNATFEDATDVVGFARYVKGEEEIACLRRAAAIAEAGIERMIEVARPGVDGAVLYARVMERMLELGSEYHELALSFGPLDGPPPPRQTQPAIGRRLAAGDAIVNEVSAVWGGQVAQEDQPVVLGPVPAAWEPVVALQREVFEAGLERMRPGTTLGELVDFVEGLGARRGMRAAVLMHGRGLGDDGPLVSPRSPGDRVRDVRLERNSAWVWKPTVWSADGQRQLVWGGDVLVTEQGGERLFARPHRLVSVS
jgi:Xaa-Pro dipeptidase